MKQTPLYTLKMFPVSSGKLHAWEGCPDADGGFEGLGSLEELDAGKYDTCQTCGLTSFAMGNVAAASTSIDNGFEYHYAKVVEASKEYVAARKAEIPAQETAKGLVESCMDAIKKALGDVSTCRIEAKAPGRDGVIVAVSSDLRTIDGTSNSSLFAAQDELGEFAAISAAVVKDDSSRDILADLLDDLPFDTGSIPARACDAVTGLWSGLINSYGEGIQGIASALENVLSWIPSGGSGSLGSWASKQFLKVVGECGFSPAKTCAAKAVLVNTSKVAAKGEGPVSESIVEIKRIEDAWLGG